MKLLCILTVAWILVVKAAEGQFTPPRGPEEPKYYQIQFMGLSTTRGKFCLDSVLNGGKETVIATVCSTSQTQDYSLFRYGDEGLFLLRPRTKEAQCLERVDNRSGPRNTSNVTLSMVPCINPPILIKTCDPSEVKQHFFYASVSEKDAGEKVVIQSLNERFTSAKCGRIHYVHKFMWGWGVIRNVPEDIWEGTCKDEGVPALYLDTKHKDPTDTFVPVMVSPATTPEKYKFLLKMHDRSCSKAALTKEEET